MDIKRAKQEIKNTIEAYLAKDAFGEYRIPSIRQRPVLLMGPPGIGKTQIMEQISKEMEIALVAYTITHHTRQSAVGLPFIREKTYGGRTFSVTEYTMSEIIASVYEKMEQTGIREGILFLDEINCVSETLAPTMLQFLQGKTFGNQKLPEGWIIVAAGNPPEYNKSVREFDVVTLDRLKRIDVEPDFPAWKEYAYRQGIHPAVISYLELRKENFCRIENTVDGKRFATARGWEDLSQLIQVYEDLGKTVDRDVVYQYIQHRTAAKDFANYLELYYKYKQDYQVEDILNGQWSKTAVEKVKAAPFDERLSIVSLLNSALGTLFRECFDQDAYVAKLYEYLIYYRDNQSVMMLDDVRALAEKDLEEQRRAEILTKAQEHTMSRVIDALSRFSLEIRGEMFVGDGALDEVKDMFGREREELDRMTEHTSESLDNAFRFLEDAFGESQEMVAFVTELNANSYSVWFINENGNDLYYRHNKGLLFEERHENVVRQMEQAEEMLNSALKS